MFCTTHIEVDGHPVLFLLLGDELFGVVRIEVAQIVPAGACPLGHRVGLTLGFAAANRTGGVHPAVNLCKRTFSGTAGFVTGYFGKQQGKLFFGNSNRAAGGAVHQGDGFTPVPLPAENPVPELVVDRLCPQLMLFEPSKHGGNGILLVQAIKEGAVYVNAILGPRFLLDIDLTLENFNDGQAELLGKLPVTGVMGRDCHDGTGTVADQDIVGNPDGNLLVVHRVDRKAATEDAALILGKVSALEVALAGACLKVGLDRLFLAFGGQLCNKRMFWGYYHVGSTEERIGTSGIDFELLIKAIYREKD
ncbi:hypothetical protein SDC9_120310 [bioreactor metagenome]|uniref:Uncharacterized protein n=1 Tax=bioreactor metagenome TaxID=1076179 RepID=A0A645C6E6_9ZZZZ